MILEKILFAGLISFTILAAHELGHYFIHLKNGRKPRMHFWYVTFDLVPENKEEFQIAAATGIITGLLAITLFWRHISATTTAVLILAYLVCCFSDIQQIRGKKPYAEKSI